MRAGSRIGGNLTSEFTPDWFDVGPTRDLPCELSAMTNAQFSLFHLSPLPPHSTVLLSMSELDADLYGGRYFACTLLFGAPNTALPDLYGNDEAAFASAVESHELKPEELTTEVPPETPAPPAAKLSEVKQEPTITTPASQSMKSEYIEMSSQFGPSPQNAPQQIPTYQQSSDYLVDASRADSYDRPLIPERSIRPSEMKDEG